MNGIEVLRKASAIITSHGLAIGAGQDKAGHVCTASALVRAARHNATGKFDEKAYLEARMHLANHLGIASTYQAVVDWNDAFRTTHEGIRLHYRNTSEVVKTLNKAADKAELKENENVQD